MNAELKAKFKGPVFESPEDFSDILNKELEVIEWALKNNLFTDEMAADAQRVVATTRKDIKDNNTIDFMDDSIDTYEVLSSLCEERYEWEREPMDIEDAEPPERWGWYPLGMAPYWPPHCDHDWAADKLLNLNELLK